ncbi:hypothetical protein IWQ57_003099 [Coemansia nantahalensis]|uniref:Uncharacterized protein n=1 Tax=Coemansia nantahalensis TaxID=2789366 RepID=A0ACC1JXY0_9FUNG|nr:hypothetical protein IWQ57_003099 [Coemansia nantahalensis]
MRICLPRRFGKTFCLSVIAEFFNVVTVNDVPRSADAGDLGEAPAETLDEAPAEALAKARTGRRAMFSGSLLEQSDKNGLMNRDGPFFARHFAKHPVIRIDFKEVSGSTVGEFYMYLAGALLESAYYWIAAYDRPELVKPSAQSEYEALGKRHQKLESKLDDGDDTWEQLGIAALSLFKALDKFLAAQHQSRYIVLLDEYDTPLTAILRTAWYDRARRVYTSLLSKIFKTNPNLLFGLMVGVNEFRLAELDSGVNNIARIEMTTGRFNPTPEDPWHRPTDQDEDGVASLFAFSREEVAQLVDRACGSSTGLGAHSQGVILDTITTWYDGYDFGFEDKRYNPLSVMSFLRRLTRGPRNLVGQSFWEETGNQRRIEDLARSRSADILLLAPKLVAGSDSTAGHTGLRAVGVHRRRWVAPQDDDAIDIVIGDSTYADPSGNIMDMNGLVTMMLHLGYVTIGAGNTVRIPNRELHAMWDELRVLAAYGTMDSHEVTPTRHRLLKGLYEGDVSGLLRIRSITNRLSNAINNYNEEHHAGVVGAFLMTLLSGLAGDDHSDRPTFIPEREGGAGRLDLAVTFESSARLPGGLVLLIEYKRMDPRARRRPGSLLAEARKGLAQIVDNNNAAPFSDYARRLDISFGIDQRLVVVRQRLWVRVETPMDADLRSGVPQLREPDETAVDWDRRMVEADDDGWRDGHGWRTVHLDADLRDLDRGV